MRMLIHYIPFREGFLTVTLELCLASPYTILWIAIGTALTLFMHGLILRGILTMIE